MANKNGGRSFFENLSNFPQQNQGEQTLTDDGIAPIIVL